MPASLASRLAARVVYCISTCRLFSPVLAGSWQPPATSTTCCARRQSHARRPPRHTPPNAAKSLTGVTALLGALPAPCGAQLSKVTRTCASDSDPEADDPDMTSLSTKDGCCLAPCHKAMQEVGGPRRAGFKCVVVLVCAARLCAHVYCALHLNTCTCRTSSLEHPLLLYCSSVAGPPQSVDSGCFAKLMAALCASAAASAKYQAGL